MEALAVFASALTVVPVILSIVAGAGTVESLAPGFPPSNKMDGMKNPFYLIDAGLNQSVIDLRKIGSAEIGFQDSNGRDRKRPIRGVLALLKISSGARRNVPAENAGQSPFAGNGEIQVPNGATENASAWTGPALRLTDGRVLAGQLKSVDAALEFIIWESDQLGTLAASFDDLRHLTLHPAISKPDNVPNAAADGDQSPGGDVVELVNGDRIHGFISGLTLRSVEIETADDRITLESDLVASLSFENEPLRPNADACRIWLDDGSVVDVDTTRFKTEGGSLRLALRGGGGGDRFVPFQTVRAVAFRAGTVRSLSSLNPRMIDKADYDANEIIWYDLSVQPLVENSDRPLQLGDILIEGPCAIAYELPNGASSVSMFAEIPREALEWADFDLVYEMGGRELFRAHFNEEHQAEFVSFDIPSTPKSSSSSSSTSATLDLIIRVVDAGRGPIQDFIRLNRPVLLISP